VALCAAMAGPASAEPVSFRHGTLDHRFTTTEPGAASGFAYDARYHGADDPGSRPPYMRRMLSENATGVRYDTSVPDKCTASDVELATRGAAACPPGSKLGDGQTETSFMGGPPQTVAIDFLNNTNEQIIIARSPLVATVARGQIHPDGSVEFASPTCFPSVGPAGCPVDNVLQIASTVTVPPYTNASGSYLTTPSTCPADGVWRNPIHFWWADGTEDTVVATAPCTPPPPAA
jgi:hypothetical protein